MSEVIVLGAGGHAKVVVATLQDAGLRVAACYDDDARLVGQRVLGVPVLGPVSEAAANPRPAIVAIGDNATRRRVAEKMALPWTAAVHPRAYVHPTSGIGPGVLVAVGAVVQPDASLGAHAIVNTGASLDHDVALSPFAHVAPGARLAGGVQVGEGALLGVGACVAPGVRIGAWSVVGAGAAVIRDVPERAVVGGVPARLLEERR